MKKMTIPARRNAGQTGSVYAAAIGCCSVIREEPFEVTSRGSADCPSDRLQAFEFLPFLITPSPQFSDS